MAVLDKFSLKGQCSIITGAATGLGKVMAKALAEVGSNIVIADMNKEKTERTAKNLRALALK